MEQKINLKQPLQELNREGPKISLFMPAHPANPDNRQDPIVFKNLLREAEEKAKDHPELQPVLESLNQLQKNTLFWNQAKGGIGILAAPGFTNIYHLDYPVSPMVKVGTLFHILPLLRHLEEEEELYLADLGRSRVRLYQFDGQTLRPVKPEGLEEEFTDLFDDYDPTAYGSPVNFGVQSGNYHAGTTRADEMRKEREKYFRYLDGAFQKLNRSKSMSFLLAGTVETVAHFREFAKGDFYLEETIDKPLDSLESNEATEKIEQIIEKRKKEKYQSTEDLASRSLRENRAESDLAKISRMAMEGRVAELLVNEQFISENSEELDELIETLYATGAKIRTMAYEDETRTEPYLAILRY